MKTTQTLLQGDCLDLLRILPDNSIDLILTDPPYGTTQCKWDSIIPFDEMWKELKRVRKDTTPIVLFGSEPFSSYLRMSNIKEFKYDWIWDKVRGTGFLNSKRQPLRYYEILSVFYKKQCLYNPQKTYGHKRKVASLESKKKCNISEVYGDQSIKKGYDSTERYLRNIQVFSTDLQKTNLHPTQKPVSLLEYIIKTYTNENDVVLDFTMGSGSTGVAAANTNRRFVGIELDEEYFKIAKDRINENNSDIKKKDGPI